jgi:hypothetical protein
MDLRAAVQNVEIKDPFEAQFLVVEYANRILEAVRVFVSGLAVIHIIFVQNLEDPKLSWGRRCQ